MLKLSLRGIIGNRGCCYSINILRKFIKCSQGRSHIAEDAIDRHTAGLKYILFICRSFYKD